MTVPVVLLDSRREGDFPHSFRFEGYLNTITATSPEQVLPALREIEKAVANGCHAVGFLSYEAASGLDSPQYSSPPRQFPLLWFAIYREKLSGDSESLPPADCEYTASDWTLPVSCLEYDNVIGEIKARIARGETYQVNFTMPYSFAFTGNTLRFYDDICRSQKAPFCAYLDLGDQVVASASPELFFRLKGDTLTCRPMKGTAPRGRWPQEDNSARTSLHDSLKDRAENVMIVDLLRNDMGSVSRTGSVEVSSLFEVEAYPSVFQMTSTISSRLRPGTSITDIFRALFPCGSVTGAPKRRTMQIIQELEPHPRGIYTGCIGYISPGIDACFSVAIRTAVIDRGTGHGKLGIGSGITFDSDAAAEYEECKTKSLFARSPLPRFRLLESILFEEGGYFLLERHLSRLANSADRLGFHHEEKKIRERLMQLSCILNGRIKVRVTLAEDGVFSVEAVPLGPDPEHVLGVRFARRAVNSRNPLLYHKTDLRTHFEQELADAGCDEVIFVNEQGEVTEGSYHNIVVRIGGELLTPPVDSGLLPGVYREELLQDGTIKERVITPEQLAGAEEFYLINSVRRWRRAAFHRFHGNGG